MNKSRNLIEVRQDTKEAIFEIVGGEGQSKTETYKVGINVLVVKNLPFLFKFRS